MPRPSRPSNTADVRPPVKAWNLPALSLAVLALCIGAASSIISRTAHAQSQAVSFAAPTNKPYSSLGRRAATGDFNNDGKPDLIVITGPGVGSPSSSYNVGVALGNGDGILRDPLYYNIGIAPTDLTVGDFNLDGKLDVALADFSASSVQVVLGNGDGTLQNAVAYPIPPPQGELVSKLRSITTDDFDGDGRMDIAVGSETYGVCVLRNNGDGTFQSFVNYPLRAIGPFPAVPNALTSGDFNGDGRADIAVADTSFTPSTSQTFSHLRVLLNNGAGGFGADVDYSLGGRSPRSIAKGDFNGDGKLDLVTANEGASTQSGNVYDGNVAVLFGNGDGSFQSPFTYASAPFASTTYASLAIADFDKDGHADIATVYSPLTQPSIREIRVLINDGAGLFQAPVSFAAPSAWWAVAADFDRDGRADLATANDTSLGLFLNTTHVTSTFNITMTASRNPAPVEQNFNYNVSVTNDGFGPSSNTVLTDVLPAQVTLTAASTSQGTCSYASATRTVTCELGTIASGASVSVQLTVKPREEGTLDNTASVSAPDYDTANASVNGIQAQNVVKTVALQKVLLVKQVLTGGCENTTGNVYLTGPAPAGGLTVPLSSNVSGASVPASVFIAAGQSVSPAFNVTTSSVTAKQVGLIIAGSGAGSVSRGITINVGSGVCPP